MALQNSVSQIPPHEIISPPQMTPEYHDNLRQGLTIELGDIEYARIEAKLYSRENIKLTKKSNLTNILTSTAPTREADPHPPPTKIYITSADAALPHGPEHWLWEPPSYDPRDHDSWHKPLYPYFEDLGENPTIYLMCLILHTLLVRGDSGWWIIHFGYEWRGYIGNDWSGEVLPIIQNYDRWMATPLFLTTLEQHKRARDKLRKAPKKPMSPEELAEVMTLVELDL